MKIEILNPIYSQTDTPKLLKECLSFPKTIWRKTQYKKIAKEIKISKIDKTGVFYTGLIPRIQKYCKQNNIDVTINKSPEYVELIESIEVDKTRKLPGIELRDDQNRLAESALKYKRGIIVSLPGTGKTLMALQIINYLNCNTLFLVPNITLLGQTIDELNKFGFKNVARLGEGNKTFTNEKIVVSNIQTFKTLDLEKYMDYFELIIIDEVHLACRNLATIEQILSKLIAPYRIGLTASPVTTLEQEIITEGLLGPVIDEVTIEEANDIGMLAEPKLKLVPVPKTKATLNLIKYHDIHKEAIVNNTLRHKIIVNETEGMAEEGKTVIIFINEIDHGQQLFNLFSKTNLSVVFATAEMKADERMNLKNKLDKGIVDVVISSIGKEGYNVPNLGCVILADIGKSTIALIQQMGRVLRKTQFKDQGWIIDFIDEEKYLSEHFARRMKWYAEQGWV